MRGGNKRGADVDVRARFAISPSAAETQTHGAKISSSVEEKLSNFLKSMPDPVVHVECVGGSFGSVATPTDPELRRK